MATPTPVPPPPPPAPPAVAPPPGPPESAAVPEVGRLTPGWRYVTALTWAAVFVAYTGVWKASRELGLSTWWLGPVGEPSPIYVMLIPFVAPVVMFTAALNNTRRLAWYGLFASAVCAAVAVGDLGKVPRLAIVELVIAGAGAAVSIASFTGTYRSVRSNEPDPVVSTGQ